jgi:hypothetical protein
MAKADLKDAESNAAAQQIVQAESLKDAVANVAAAKKCPSRLQGCRTTCECLASRTQLAQIQGSKQSTDDTHPAGR